MTCSWSCCSGGSSRVLCRFKTGGEDWSSEAEEGEEASSVAVETREPPLETGLFGMAEIISLSFVNELVLNKELVLVRLACEASTFDEELDEDDELEDEDEEDEAPPSADEEVDEEAIGIETESLTEFTAA